MQPRVRWPSATMLPQSPSTTQSRTVRDCRKGPTQTYYKLTYPSANLRLKSSLLEFFSCFSFCLPFKILFFFFVFCPSAPFWNTFIFEGVLLSFFLLPFSLLMFPCFFATNFPNIPFFKTICFNHWLFLFFYWYCFVSCFIYLSIQGLLLLFEEGRALAWGATTQRPGTPPKPGVGG